MLWLSQWCPSPWLQQNLQCPSALEDRGDGCGLPSTGLAAQGVLAALPLTVPFHTCWACSVQELGSCEQQRLLGMSVSLHLLCFYMILRVIVWTGEGYRVVNDEALKILSLVVGNLLLK